MVICAQLTLPNPVQSVAGDSTLVKELNFVFLHGAGSNVGSLQLLTDSIMEQLPSYTLDYEQANPGTKVQVSTLTRSYPGYVDIGTWATNIADSINNHFPDKDNLILIGHSMGGKAALYAVAHNTGNLAAKVAMVVTINTPVKSLDKYFVAGGGLLEQSYRVVWPRWNEGIYNSVSYYDSSQDGYWLGSNKHWLAFISAEAAPLSQQFDYAGIDVWPRNMDDGIIPLSAQYADGADVVYYGEHGHSDFAASVGVAEFMADQILRYVFGGSIECPVLAKGGTFGHKADWLLGTDYWEDVVGEVLVNSGRLQHRNESYTKWQEWEDVVGGYSPGDERCSYQVARVGFLPIFASIQESRWLSPDDTEDCQLYLRTRAAPRSSVQVEWSIYQQGLLPPEATRHHYEVEVVAGTPLASISRVSWETDNPRDSRLRIWSEAQSPFRWFWAEWRVYYKESRQRQVINEITAKPLLGSGQGG